MAGKIAFNGKRDLVRDVGEETCFVCRMLEVVSGFGEVDLEKWIWRSGFGEVDLEKCLEAPLRILRWADEVDVQALVAGSFKC